MADRWQRKRLVIIATLWTVCFFFASLEAKEKLYDPMIVFLTWKEDPTTTMVIQWITPTDRQEDILEFRKEGEPFWTNAEGAHSFFADTSFLIHRVALRHLLPDARYEFRIGSDGVIFTFHTMPTTADAPIRFVVGGDVYRNTIKNVEKTNHVAAKTDPMFALIGGDIAYSGSHWSFLSEDSQRWIDWLKSWKKQMKTSDGCLIPIIASIGNHETNGRFDQGPAQAVCFYTLFPRPEKKGFQVLDFGDYMSLFLLDSGHTHPIGGAQARWLKGALSERENVLHKIALYHIPAYPSHGNFQNPYSASIRKHWVPLFERYGLNVAFENHCHTYKRTHPIYHGEVNPEGVLYLGDGAWGVLGTRRPRTPKQAWFLARSASRNHFILVTIDNAHRSYQAIDQQGHIFDNFFQ